jgi:aspartyl-tRNA(Asn)/glutamyl-tRNA(Gln) amidotransferase subunit A
VPHFAEHPVDSGIAREVSEAARRFEQLGHSVEEAPTFDLAEQVNSLWPTLSAVGLAWMFGTSDRWPEFVSSSGRAPDISLCGDAARASLSAGREVTGSTVFEILAAVQTLSRRLDELFARHDFILTSATAALPWPAEQTHPPDIAGQVAGPRGHAVFTAFANAAGLPAVAMPCGVVRSLPTGFQLVGRAGADRTVLALAQQYEHAHPLTDRWPDL